MRVRLLDFLKRPAVAGTGAALILRGLTLASRFLLSLLLARMLSPAEMGEYGLLTAALAFALLAIGLEFYSYTSARNGAGDAGGAGPDHCRPDRAGRRLRCW